jgi:Glycosyl transferase family 2
VKLVLTLLVRDESDIVDEHLRYHLEQGVDLVIATDTSSNDGTTEVLESYARQGCLHLLRESGDNFRQAEWVTEMARLAAVDFGADWVINSDADEFWWPREGTLKEVLGAVPGRFGLIGGLWRHFVPRPETGEPFWERMVVRGRSASVASPYWPPWLKVVHRANPAVVVSQGNHDARAPGLVLVRDWLPFEIFHFPLRSSAQMEKKLELGLAPHAAPHTRAMAEAIQVSGAESVFRTLVVDDAALAAGLADDTLAIDTRLREVLRAGTSAPASTASTQSLRDDILFAEEFDALTGIDSVVRLDRSVDEFERRLGALEKSSAISPSRMLVKLGSALRRPRGASADVT